MLLQSGDANAVLEVATGNLIWLLKRDSANLPQSQQIRQMLIEILNHLDGA
jgi:hypothetical protein